MLSYMRIVAAQAIVLLAWSGLFVVGLQQTAKPESVPHHVPVVVRAQLPYIATYYLT